MELEFNSYQEKKGKEIVMIKNKMEQSNTATAGKRTINLLFARPGRGISGKIALGAAIIGGIASLGGNLTLLFLTGTPGISSLLILICWLISIVVLSFRIPWGLLLSTILGGSYSSRVSYNSLCY